MPKARATKNSSARLEEDDPPPTEPEGEGADGFSTPGVNAGEDAATVAAASAKRLAAASAVAGELAKARVSVGSFKSSLGKVQSPEPEQIADWSSGLHTLAQSTDVSDLAVVGEIIRTLGVDAPFGTSVDVAVELVLGKEIELRPPPPPPAKSQLELLLERSLQAQEEQSRALADFRRETQEKEDRRAQVDAAVAAEVASLRSELLTSNAAVSDLTKRVATGKAATEKPDPFQEVADDRRFCPHYKTEDPGEDGVVRLNPHQDPPRPLGCAFKPHLLPGLHKSDLGKELFDHGAPEAISEYVVLKSALSYLWDYRRYFQDWSPALSQGGGHEKELAVETLVNSLDEVYNVLNYQLITISVRTRAKAKNPAGWKLSKEDQARVELLANRKKSFAELYGPEASDVPLEVYKLFADYERQKQKAAFDQSAKNAGQAQAGVGGAPFKPKNVPVKPHNRSGPTAKGTAKPAAGGGS